MVTVGSNAIGRVSMAFYHQILKCGKTVMNVKKTMFAALMGMLLALGFSLSAVAQNDLSNTEGHLEDAGGCVDTNATMDGVQLPTSGCGVIHTDQEGADGMQRTLVEEAERLWTALDTNQSELDELEKDLMEANAGIAALEDNDDTNDADHIDEMTDMGADAAARKAAALMRHKMRKTALEDVEDDAATMNVDEAMDGLVTMKRKMRDDAMEAKDAHSLLVIDTAESDISFTGTSEEKMTIATRVYAVEDAEKAEMEAMAAHTKLMDEKTKLETDLATLNTGTATTAIAEIVGDGDVATARTRITNRLKALDGVAAQPQMGTTPPVDKVTGEIEKAMNTVTAKTAEKNTAIEARNVAYGNWREHTNQGIVTQKMDYDSKAATLAMRTKALADAKANLEKLEDDDDTNDAAVLTAVGVGDKMATIGSLKTEIDRLEAKAPESDPMNIPAGSIAEAMQTAHMSKTELARLVSLRNASVVADSSVSGLADALVEGNANASHLVDAISTNYGQIVVNRGNIATNRSDIATNTANITTNRDAIAGNGRLISQLQTDVETIRSGVAAALAVAGMPTPPGDGWGFAVGTGHFDGESAFSAGFSFNDESSSYKFSVGTSGGETTVSAGGAWNF